MTQQYHHHHHPLPLPQKMKQDRPPQLSPIDTVQQRTPLVLTGRLLLGSLFLPYTVFEEPSTPTSTHTHLSQQQANFTVYPSSLGNIGLQNALRSLPELAQVYWIGLTGIQTDLWNQHKRELIRNKLAEYMCIPVFPNDDEAEGHYHRFCKQVLWKSFHYQLPEYPKLQSYEANAWKHYVVVNELFAEKLIDIYKVGDTIWINDYHLLLVPSLVRQKLPSARIGFFLHIPFPSTEIFRCLYVRKEILQGLLGADLIGFQTYSFMRHFLMTATRILGLESTPRGILLDHSTVSVGIFPIGINFAALNEKRCMPEVPDMVASLGQKYASMKVLIGRDKNDYVKGVRQKLIAYERFLQQHPEWVSRVVLIQVVLPTTEANETEAQVQDVVARINSKYGSIEYIPVVYFQQDISFSQYLALLTIADACLITSLRDGMNLTSHEYIICQSEKKSPLIISEFAGTYGSFGSAIRVNPWDISEVADAIYEALTMPEEEKASRWKELSNHVRAYSAQNFVVTFLGQLGQVHEEMQKTVGYSIPKLPVEMLLADVKSNSRRLFFLDHDGTICKHRNNNSAANEKLKHLVQCLASVSKNIVYIMSGRTKDALADFMNIPNLGLSAESGCFVKWADKDQWETMIPDTNFSWKQNVLEIFEYYTDRTPGSSIEMKEASVVWHFNNSTVDPSFGSWQAAECQNHIEVSLGAVYPIHTLLKKRQLEILPRSVNKGTIVRRALKHHNSRAKHCSSQHLHSHTHHHAHHSHHHTHVHSQDSTTGSSSSHSSLNPSDNSTPKDSKSHVPHTLQHHHLASTHLHAPIPSIDFIFAVGDDRADEYMFEFLLQLERDSTILSSQPGTPSLLSTKSGNSTPMLQDLPLPVTEIIDVLSNFSMTASHSSMPPSEAPSSIYVPQTPRSPHSQSAISPIPNIVTCTVGSKASSAKYYVSSVSEVLAFLDSVACIH